MSALVQFSPELKEWIAANLARGCAPAMLVDSMAGQGFDMQVARGLVMTFAEALARGATVDGDSVVLELADEPALGSDASPDVTANSGTCEPARAGTYIADPTRLPPGNSIVAADRTIDILVRLQRPCVAVLGNVLSAVECDAVMRLGAPRLAPSTVVDPLSGTDQVAQHRSSDGMFFGLCENELIERIDRRVSALMGLPLAHGEGLQLLRYRPGCHSSAHYDFLVPHHARNRASIARSGQRVSTLVIYLNDVAAGGATDFPELGLSVTPRRGNAVYFEYANRAGELDHATLHAGAPVESGEKWVLTKWMRARPFIAAD